MTFSTAQHLFFDLDHTLWDFDKNSRLAYQRIFEEYQLHLSIDTFIKIYEPLNLQFWRKYRNNEINKEELRYQRLKTAFDACDFEISDDHINTFADLYIEYLSVNNHLFDGCIELLEHLDGNYELHCITNGFIEIQDKKLINSKLKPFFNTILTAEEAGTKKPDPKIFELAMKRAGATAGNSVMIGDSYEADIMGAHQVGMKTIYFEPHGNHVDGVGHRVSNLSQIKLLF
jgi:putative hydrolase of the HAD superfamily